MSNREESIAWLQERTVAYLSGEDGMGKVVDDFDEVGNLVRVLRWSTNWRKLMLDMDKGHDRRMLTHD
jgi:hypothetical protein